MIAKSDANVAVPFSDNLALQSKVLDPREYIDQYVVVSVSGVEYRIKAGYLKRFPESLLNKIVFENTEMTKSAESAIVRRSSRLQQTPNVHERKLFFQRSPLIFDLVILQCYITGKFHVPKWMCPESILDELKFWKLDISYACSCCAEEQHNELDTFDEEPASPVSTPEESSPIVINGRHSSVKRISLSYIKRRSTMISNWEHQRRKLWTFLQYPSSSCGALIFGIASLIFVFLSIAHLTIESFRTFSNCTKDFCNEPPNNDLTPASNNAHPSERDSFGIDKSINITGDTHFTGNYSSAMYYNDSSLADMSDDLMDEVPCRFLSVCPQRRMLQYLEFITMAWFTLELFIRIISCPSWRKFIKSPLNLFDVVSTVPFYVELVVVLIRQASRNHSAHKAILALQLLRCLRVFRILKLARYFEELRILGNTMKAAKNELCMLFLFVLIAIFMFSSIIYQFEKDQPNTLFTSIPASAWFGIATVTTVGYGDMTPTTTAGKIVAAVACITGVMITAFPVSVLVEHFTSTYKNKTKRMFVVPHFKYNIPFYKRKVQRIKDSKQQSDIVVVRSRSEESAP